MTVKQDNRIPNISTNKKEDRGIIWRGKRVYRHEEGEIQETKICEGTDFNDSGSTAMRQKK